MPSEEDPYELGFRIGRDFQRREDIEEFLEGYEKKHKEISDIDKKLGDAIKEANFQRINQEYARLFLFITSMIREIEKWEERLK